MVVTKYADCPDYLSEFLFYMETIRNSSERTVSGYYTDVKMFLRYIKLRKGLCPADTPLDEISIHDVDIETVRSIKQIDIYEFLHYVTQQRKNSPASRARKVSSLRSFFKYLNTKTNLLAQNPMKDIEVPALRKSLPKYLSLEEAMELLNSVSGDFSARDYCMITLFLNCGMRLSELVGIDIGDIKEDTIRIVGKGNKERLVYLNDACKAALEAYFDDAALQRKPGEHALFISSRGSRITPRRVEQIVDDSLKLAGLSGQGYSPHKLRHTAATLMYQHGDVDMLALKEILGHEHVSTTEIYTHINSQQLKDAVSSSPLADIKPKKNKHSNGESVPEEPQE